MRAGLASWMSYRRVGRNPMVSRSVCRMPSALAIRQDSTVGADVLGALEAPRFTDDPLDPGPIDELDIANPERRRHFDREFPKCRFGHLPNLQSNPRAVVDPHQA